MSKYFNISVQPTTPAKIDNKGKQLKKYRRKPKEAISGFFWCDKCHRAYNLNMKAGHCHVEYYKRDSGIVGNTDRVCPDCAGEKWKPYKPY